MASAAFRSSLNASRDFLFTRLALTITAPYDKLSAVIRRFREANLKVVKDCKRFEKV